MGRNASFEKALEGNKIIGEKEFVYPIKNGIETARQEAKEWVRECINKIN